jgi:hypothetical protein
MPDDGAGWDQAGAGLAIADGLTGLDFEVRDLTGERAHVLQVTDARGAFCQLTVSTGGLVTWEYVPFAGPAADPGQLAAMIAGILDGATAPARPWPGPTLTGTAGRMLRDLGLDVRLGITDRHEEFCEVYADLIVTDQGRPERGTVLLSDEGMITWECPLAPARSPGLTAPAVAAAIGRVLSQAQYPGHPAPVPGRRRAGA